MSKVCLLKSLVVVKMSLCSVLIELFMNNGRCQVDWTVADWFMCEDGTQGFDVWTFQIMATR